MSRSTVLVRGSGDVGSAVAVVLHRAGYGVAIHEVAAPSAPRRGMAFADAVFDGECVLDGVVARRVALSALPGAVADGAAVPVCVGPIDEALARSRSTSSSTRGCASASGRSARSSSRR